MDGSVTNASDILSQLDRALVATDEVRRRTRKRANNDDDHDDDDHHHSSAKRAADSGGGGGLAAVLRGVVELRERVSLNEHLQRLLFVLNWSDRHGGRWMGISHFIDCYFSTVFHPYLGDAFRMNIVHVAKARKICALFSPGSDRSYTILVMLNYPLWDQILQVATALPNRYFRRSIRARLRGRHSDPLGPPSADSITFSPLFNLSLAALCLVDRLEYSMQSDLDSSHLITLARFFANSQDAKQLFNTTTVYE